MPFCTSCGAKLEEGQTCVCQQPQSAKISLGKGQRANAQPNMSQAEMPQQNVQQEMPQQNVQQNVQQEMPQQNIQPAPQSNKPNIFKEGLNQILNYFKAIIKKPFDATEEFFNIANPVASGITWFVLLSVYVVANFLNTIIGAVLMDNYKAGRFYYMSMNSDNFLRALYNDGAAEQLLYHVGVANYLQAFFFPILWMTCMTVVVFGIGLLINLIFVKANFKQALCKIGAICGVTSIGLIVIQILAMIRNIIAVDGLNVLFTAAQSIVALFVVVQGLICINKVIPDKNKTALAVIISIAGLTISDCVLNLFFGFFAPYFIPLAF